MNAKGYQLIELTIVCALAMVLAAAAPTLWKGVMERQRLQSACRLVLAAGNQARVQALGKNATVELRVHEDLRSFALAAGGGPERWQPLPQGVEFTSPPPRPPRFHSRGNAAPGASLYLENAAGQARVVISPSGRLRWELVQ